MQCVQAKCAKCALQGEARARHGRALKLAHVPLKAPVGGQGAPGEHLEGAPGHLTNSLVVTRIPGAWERLGWRGNAYKIPSLLTKQVTSAAIDPRSITPLA